MPNDITLFQALAQHNLGVGDNGFYKQAESLQRGVAEYEPLLVGELFGSDSMWDAGIRPEDILRPRGVEYYRGAQQPGIFKLAATVNPGYINALTLHKTLEAFGHVAGAIALMPFNDWSLQPVIDNAMTRALYKSEEDLKNSVPLYQTQDYAEGKFFDKITSANFWASDATDGLAFMASAMVPGAALGKAGKAVQLLGGTVYNTISESASEAYNTKETVKEELAESRFNKVYADLEIGEKQLVDQEAGQLASSVMKNNMTMLAANNLFQMGLMFGGFGGNTAGLAGKALRGEKLAVGNWKKYLGAVIEGAASEGLYEEGIQNAIQSQASAIARGEKKNPESFNEQLFGVMEEYWKGFTTTEGQTSMFLGAVLGSPMGVHSTHSEISKLKEYDKIAEDRLNAIYQTKDNTFVITDPKIARLNELASMKKTPEVTNEIKNLRNDFFGAELDALTLDNTDLGVLQTNVYDTLKDHYTNISQTDNSKDYADTYYRPQIEKIDNELAKYPIDERSKAQYEQDGTLQQVLERVQKLTEDRAKLSEAYNNTKGKTEAMVMGLSNDKSDNEYADYAKNVVDKLNAYRAVHYQLTNKFDSMEEFRHDIAGKILKEYIKSDIAATNIKNSVDAINDLAASEVQDETIDKNLVNYKRVQALQTAYRNAAKANKNAKANKYYFIKESQLASELESIQRDDDLSRETESKGHRNLAALKYNNNEFNTSLSNLSQQVTQSEVDRQEAKRLYDYYQTPQGINGLIESAKSFAKHGTTDTNKIVAQDSGVKLGEEITRTVEEAENDIAPAVVSLSNTATKPKFNLNLTAEDMNKAAEEETTIVKPTVKSKFTVASAPKTQNVEEELVTEDAVVNNTETEEVSREELEVVPEQKVEDEYKEALDDINNTDGTQELEPSTVKLVNSAVKKFTITPEKVTEPEQKLIEADVLRQEKSQKQLEDYNSISADLKEISIEAANLKQVDMTKQGHAANKLFGLTKKVEAKLDKADLPNDIDLKLRGVIKELKDNLSFYRKLVKHVEGLEKVSIFRNESELLEIAPFDKDAERRRTVQENIDTITVDNIKDIQIEVVDTDNTPGKFQFKHYVNNKLVEATDSPLRKERFLKKLYHVSKSDGTSLGSLFRPDVYYLNDRKLDPNSVQDLKYFNHEFVDENSEITEKGVKFLQNYNTMMNIFKVLDDSGAGTYKLSELKGVDIKLAVDYDNRADNYSLKEFEPNVFKGENEYYVYDNRYGKTLVYKVDNNRDFIRDANGIPTTEYIGVFDDIENAVNTYKEYGTTRFALITKIGGIYVPVTLNNDKHTYETIHGPAIIGFFKSIPNLVSESIFNNNPEKFSSNVRHIQNYLNKKVSVTVMKDETGNTIEASFKIGNKLADSLGIEFKYTTGTRKSLGRIQLPYSELAKLETIDDLTKLINSKAKSLKVLVHRVIPQTIYKAADFQFPELEYMDVHGKPFVKLIADYNEISREEDVTVAEKVSNNTLTQADINAIAETKDNIEETSDEDIIEIVNTNETASEIDFKVNPDIDMSGMQTEKIESSWYSISKEPAVVSYEEAVSNLSKILDIENNPFLSVQDITELYQKEKESGISIARFFNGVIGLQDTNIRGAEYHEAFHAVFRMFLNDYEVNKYLKLGVRELFNGKLPAESDIKELREYHPELNDKQLRELAVEEKLAEEFRKYMNRRRGILAPLIKLFDKINNWINSIRGKEDTIRSLFNKISTAQFKGAKPVSIRYSDPNLSANLILKTSIIQKSGKSVSTFLSAPQSNLIVNRIVQKLAVNNQGFSIPTDNQIVEEIYRLRDEYYNETNWLSETSNKESLLDRVSQVRRALNDKDNIIEIIREVKKRATLLNLKSVEDSNLESDLEDTGNTNLYATSAKEQKGGFDSASKLIKLYLTTVSNYTDEFNFGLTEEQLQDEKYFAPIDVFNTHNGIERMLADIPKEKMLFRLSQAAKEDSRSAMAAFFDKLSKDIGYTGELTPKVRSHYMYNLFIRQYYKTRPTQYTQIGDLAKNEYMVVEANRSNAKNTQVTDWSNNLRTLIDRNSIDKKSFVKVLTDIDSIINKKENIVFPDANTLNKSIKQLRDSFKSVGIHLSPAYIKYSILANNSAKIDSYLNESEPVFETRSGVELINPEYVKDLYNFKNAFTGVKGIFDNDNITEIIKTVEKATAEDVNKWNPFIKDSENSDTLSRFRNIAEGNSIFDATVSQSTFKSAEGKTLYDVMYHSFYTEEALSFQNPEKREMLKKPFSEVKERFKELYLIYDDYLAEGLHAFLADNYLVNHPDADLIFDKDFKLAIQDGVRFTELVRLGDTLKQAEGDVISKAVSYSAADIRTKALENIIMYFKNMKAKKRGEVSKNFTLFNTGVIADKSTSLLINLPIEDYVTGDAKNVKAINTLYKMFEQEFKRIYRVNQDIQNDRGQEIWALDKVKNAYKLSKDSPDVNKSRGLHLFNFKGLELDGVDITNEIEQAALNNQEVPVALQTKVKNALYRMLVRQQQDLLNFTEKTLGLIKKTATGYSAETLPKELLIGKTLNIPAYWNFYLNDYINSMAMNQLLDGDDAVVFKDHMDKIKRNGGKIASGSSFLEDVNIAYVQSLNKLVTPRIINEDLSEYISKDEAGEDYIDAVKVNKAVEENKITSSKAREIMSYTADTTDAQSLGRLSLHKNYLRSEGKLTPIIEAILKKQERGFALTQNDIKILENGNAMLADRKFVSRDRFYYNKLSTNFITRDRVSRLRDGLTRDEVNVAYDELDKIKAKLNSSENPEIVKQQISEFYRDVIHLMYEPVYGSEELHYLLNEMELKDIDITMFDTAAKMLNQHTSKVPQDSQSWNLTSQKTAGSTWREQVSTDGTKSKIVDGTQTMGLIWSEQSPETATKINGNDTTIGEVSKMYVNLLAQRVSKSLAKKESKLVTSKGEIKNEDLYGAVQNSLERSGGDQVLIELTSLINGVPKYNLNLPQVIAKAEQIFNSYISKDTLKQKAPGHKLTLVSDYGNQVIVEKSTGRVVRKDELKSKPYSEWNNDKYVKRRLQHGKFDSNTGKYYSECIIPKKTADAFGLKIGENIPEHMANMLGVRIPTQDKHSMINLRIVDYLPAEHNNSIIMPYETIRLSGEDFDIDSKFVRTYDYTKFLGKDILFGDYMKSKYPVDSGIKEMILSEYSKIDFKYKDITLNTTKNFTTEEVVSIKDGDLLELSDTSKKLIIDSIGLELKGSVNNNLLLSVKALALAKSYNLTPSQLYSKYFKTAQSVIENNNKAISTGKFSDYKVLTVNEANNLLLDASLSLSRNNGNIKIANTPATMDIFKDLWADMQEELGVQEPTNVGGTNNFVDKMKIQFAADTGKDNIGPAALMNIAFQILYKSKVGIVNTEKNNPILGKYDSFSSLSTEFKGEELRINDIISSFISSATDNMKEGDAARFNLTTDNLGAALTMIMMGVPFDTTMYFMQTGIMKRYTQLMTIAKSKSKSALEKEVNRSAIISLLQEEYKVPSLSEAIPFDADPNTALKNIIKKDLNEDFAVDEKIRKGHLAYILSTMKDVQEYAQELTSFSKLLGLNKGTKPSFIENDAIIKALDELGLTVTDNELKATEREPKLNIRTAISNHPILVENIKTLVKIDDIASKVFVTRTKVGKNIIQSTIDNAAQGTFDYEDTIELLNKNFLSYIGIKAFQKLTGAKTNLDKVFTDRIHKAIVAIKSNENYRLNAFIKNLILEPVKVTSGRFTNQTVYKITIPNDVNQNPNILERMLDGYRQLLSDNSPIIPGYSAATLAGDLFLYLQMKDGMQFKRYSFVKHLHPLVLGKFSKALGNSVEALNSPVNIENTFGDTITATSLKEEFLDLFFRDINNSKLVGKFFEVPQVIKFEGKIYKSPVTIVNNQLKIDLLNNINNEYQALNEEQQERFKLNSKLLNKVLDKSNVSLLSDKGLAFPKYVKVGATLYKNTSIRPSVTELEVINPINRTGIAATYEIVSSIGTSEVLPYAITPQEWDAYAKTTPVVEEFEEVPEGFATPSPVTGTPVFKARAVDSVSNKKIGKNAMIAVLDSLAERTNIPFEFDYTQSTLGRFQNNKVFINPNKATADTLFHEYAHPFIHMVKKYNSEVYQNLTEEVQKDKELMNWVKEKYSDLDSESQVEEAIVTAIGNLAADLNAKKKSSILAALEQFFKSLTQLIFKTTGTKISPFDLANNTTLEQIADIFITQEIDIQGLGSNVSNYMKSLNKEQRDLMRELINTNRIKIIC